MQIPVRQNGAGPAVTPTPMHPGYLSALFPLHPLHVDGKIAWQTLFWARTVIVHMEVLKTSMLSSARNDLRTTAWFANPRSTRRVSTKPIASINKSLCGEQHTPQSKYLTPRLSASPISPSFTASAMSPPAVPGLASRKGYRVESDVEDNTNGAGGMDVVAQTPAEKGAKGRKSSVAASAVGGAGAGIKRSGSKRMMRDSRKIEVGEGIEVD
ncbi:hypothetical protein M408DRAFT_19949 [Serendipita vermifera MAFF 305830]|uniref:Uncharacterized protein n=1 Tax=Serendipita vermifera MAFF 305830 TaxID=933852 RepID=A0A0C3B6U7_SERVB|nr:hypothetical protein M408DRAFT_19949 [Serendipita vermifera MAFF 305830]